MKTIDPHLCGRCQAGVVTFDEYDRRYTHCNRMGEYGGPIGRQDIRRCNSYTNAIDSDAHIPYEIREKGWILEHRKGQIIGFKPPKKAGEV